jgi:hypothetical protein
MTMSLPQRIEAHEALNEALDLYRRMFNTSPNTWQMPVDDYPKLAALWRACVQRGSPPPDIDTAPRSHRDHRTGARR